jgi:putative transposase
MLGLLHARTAGWINRLDGEPKRRVWHNFWDTKLTYEKSYLARMNYVHQNAVKHGLVPVANQYRWCSARWFEQTASPAMVRSIYRFKIDQLSIRDNFAPVVKPQPLLESAGAPAHSKTQARKERSICRPRFGVRR